MVSALVMLCVIVSIILRWSSIPVPAVYKPRVISLVPPSVALRLIIAKYAQVLKHFLIYVSYYIAYNLIDTIIIFLRALLPALLRFA